MSEEKIMIEMTVTELKVLADAGAHGPFRRLRGEARAALEALKPPSVESRLNDLRAPWQLDKSSAQVKDREGNELTDDSCWDQDRTIVNAPDAFAMLRTMYDAGSVPIDDMVALLERSGWL